MQLGWKSKEERKIKLSNIFKIKKERGKDILESLYTRVSFCSTFPTSDFFYIYSNLVLNNLTLIYFSIEVSKTSNLSFFL